MGEEAPELSLYPGEARSGSGATLESACAAEMGSGVGMSAVYEEKLLM